MIRILLISLLLSGCSTIKPDIYQTSFHLRFVPSENLTKPGYETVKALTSPGDGICTIKMDMRYYSHDCLGHELRHCLEGFWHGDDVVNCH